MTLAMRIPALGLLAVTTIGCSSARAAPARDAAASWRRPVLVELFTSQGCGSCPPADAFVGQLPALGLGKDKVVPLTFHVDYWDRLGWKDPFASGASTGRQEWYARSGKLRSPDGAGGLDGLYTPQMIVDGAVQLSGQRRETALREIEQAAGRPPRFDLGVQPIARGSTLDLTVTVTALEPPRHDQDWQLVAALAAKKTRTRVGRGENAGETLEETAVVRALSERNPLPAPGGTVRLRLPKPADLPWSNVEVVVFSQSSSTGEIGAVRTADPR
jgi:hypothetical protein